MTRYTNDALLALYYALIADETSNDAQLGAVVQELDARGL